ncbi:MAG TPA: hypothetical protein VFF30_16205 [Nitrososphaerales archaeon]|nr:hypothetical protein [Nitrososphaerales archaeon]
MIATPAKDQVAIAGPSQGNLKKSWKLARITAMTTIALIVAAIVASERIATSLPSINNDLNARGNAHMERQATISS